MSIFSLNEHPRAYHLTPEEKAALTLQGGEHPIYAARHRALATNRDTCAFGRLSHRFIALLEDCPLIGQLVARIECWLFRSLHNFNKELTSLNAATIRKLIGAGIDPNLIDAQGYTPLTRLISRATALGPLEDRTPYLETMTALIEGGADINKRNKFGQTPLSMAVTCSQNFPIIERLLELGAETTTRTQNKNNVGLSPLQITCIFTDSKPIVELLLRNYASASWEGTIGGHQTSLMIAASFPNKLEIVKALLASENDRKQELLDMQDGIGETALHKAVRKARSIDIIRTLIEAGANKHLTDNKGRKAVELTTDPAIQALLNA